MTSTIPTDTQRAVIDLVHFQALDALEAANNGDRAALVQTVERCPDPAMLAGILAGVAMKFAAQVGRPDRRIAELRASLVADIELQRQPSAELQSVTETGAGR